MNQVRLAYRRWRSTYSFSVLLQVFYLLLTALVAVLISSRILLQITELGLARARLRQEIAVLEGNLSTLSSLPFDLNSATAKVLAYLPPEGAGVLTASAVRKLYLEHSARLTDLTGATGGKEMVEITHKAQTTPAALPGLIEGYSRLFPMTVLTELKLGEASGDGSNLTVVVGSLSLDLPKGQTNPDTALPSLGQEEQQLLQQLTTAPTGPTGGGSFSPQSNPDRGNPFAF